MDDRSSPSTSTLERLEGAEEAAVVRSALGAGVSDGLVVEELEREVERRLTRMHGFYDGQEL